ncbi:MAG: sarcosine oxidase subunit gamma [Ilumatobacteraceae bacterium]
MAEEPRFESPVVAVYDTSADAPLLLADESALRKTIVRADASSYPAAQLGVDFGASRVLDDVLVCGQRPGEWILLGTIEANDTLASDLDSSGHVSLIDHTHARALFRLTGSDAARTLEKLCDLDWSDPMTPDGAVTSGVVARVNCDLVRNDRAGSPSYLIMCDRSFGQYLFDALLDAGTEFEIAVAP